MKRPFAMRIGRRDAKQAAAGESEPDDPPEQVRTGRCTECGGTGFVPMPGSNKYTACRCVIARRERVRDDGRKES